MNITKESITRFGRRSIKLYATEVNLDRAVPDLVDGLKPVQRRIAYGASLFPNGRLVKSAELAGFVMGKFHPHGNCLRGNTTVPLLNGKTTTIKELALNNKGKRYVLAYDKESKSYVPALAYAWRIGQTTDKMYRVTLHNGDIFEATGNHRFFTDDGEIRADKLRAGINLTGGQFVMKDEYLFLRDDYVSKPIHRIIGEFSKGTPPKTYAFHHINGNKFDNRPTNLEILSNSEHSAEHADDQTYGLVKGRTAMFKGNTKLTRAIKEKNSILMSEYNNKQGIIKAFKAVSIIKSRGIKVNKESYNSFLSTKEIYNLTSLKTLSKHGYNLTRILKEKTYSLNTSEAIGLTVGIKKQPGFKPRSKDAEASGLWQGVTTVFKSLLSYCSLEEIDWKLYEIEASEITKKDVNSNYSLIYSSRRKIKAKLNISTVAGLFAAVPTKYMRMVAKVELINLENAEDFYDFTVDKYENMVIQPAKESTTFVVVHNSSIESAAVTMVQAIAPLLYGEGNWGNLVDPAAAARYVNCKLSNYGNTIFDDNYINKEVTAFVPNYSDTMFEPVALPVPLPNVLLNGGEGIGVGITCVLPTFTIDSVMVVLRKLLTSEKLGIPDFAKLMKPSFQYGGKLAKSKVNSEEWLKLFTTSSASIQFESNLVVDSDKRTIMINNWPNGLNPVKFVDKIRVMPECQEMQLSKGTLEYTIVGKRGFNLTQFEAFVAKVQRATQVKRSFKINVTRRQATIVDGVVDYKVDLLSLSVPKLLVTWLRARLETETKSLNYRIGKISLAIAYSELLIYASLPVNLKVMFNALELGGKDPIAYISKNMKVTVDQATQLFDLRFRQLSKLDTDVLKSKLKEQQSHLKQLNTWLKNPKAKVLADAELAYLAIQADVAYQLKKDNEVLKSK